MLTTRAATLEESSDSKKVNPRSHDPGHIIRDFSLLSNGLIRQEKYHSVTHNWILRSCLTDLLGILPKFVVKSQAALSKTKFSPAKDRGTMKGCKIVVL